MFMLLFLFMIKILKKIVTIIELFKGMRNVQLFFFMDD